MIEQHMLTTIDNPFDPFDSYAEWFAYDVFLQHNTSEFLARIVWSSPELSETDQHQAIEWGIDEIIRLDPTGIYKKVSRKIEITSVPAE